jgi:hypothetical protein
MGVVPDHLRPAIRQELDALVRGEGPEFVLQPDDIWTHEWTDAELLPDGRCHVLLPVWATDESPSDLTAEVHVGTDRRATPLYDLHVL